MIDQLAFCIFSYNKGQFLRNCIESIEICAPGVPIYIFDDDSTDSDTQQYIDSISTKHHVVINKKKGDGKHGGLYHNMQVAFETLENFSLLCFLQDDTQITRPLDSIEIQNFSAAFKKYPSLGFIHPCFIRAIDANKNTITPREGLIDNSYFRSDTGQSAGIHYSDIVLFSPEKLRENDWYFTNSEPRNDKLAKQVFGSMLYLYSPFAMWLPEVPAYRGKKKTRALKIAERKRGCGFYPFNIWTNVQVRQFLGRQNYDVPIAEKHLECNPQPEYEVWRYNPLSGYPFLKKLNIIELFLTRWIQKIKNKQHV